MSFPAGEGDRVIIQTGEGSPVVRRVKVQGARGFEPVFGVIVHHVPRANKGHKTSEYQGND